MKSVGLESDRFEKVRLGRATSASGPRFARSCGCGRLRLDGFEAGLTWPGAFHYPLGNLTHKFALRINHMPQCNWNTGPKKVALRAYLFSFTAALMGRQGRQRLNRRRENRRNSTPLLIDARPLCVVEKVAQLARPEWQPGVSAQCDRLWVSPRLRFDLVLEQLRLWALTNGPRVIKSADTPWRRLCTCRHSRRRLYGSSRRAARGLDYTIRAFNVRPAPAKRTPKIRDPCGNCAENSLRCGG